MKTLIGYFRFLLANPGNRFGAIAIARNNNPEQNSYSKGNRQMYESRDIG